MTDRQAHCILLLMDSGRGQKLTIRPPSVSLATSWNTRSKGYCWSRLASAICPTSSHPFPWNVSLRQSCPAQPVSRACLVLSCYQHHPSANPAREGGPALGVPKQAKGASHKPRNRVAGLGGSSGRHSPLGMSSGLPACSPLSPSLISWSPRMSRLTLFWHAEYLAPAKLVTYLVVTDRHTHKPSAFAASPQACNTYLGSAAPRQ